MPIDMTPAINALATSVLVIDRPSSTGSYVLGVWTPAAIEQLSIVAQITPAGPREIQRLPEGEQTKEAILIYSGSELRTEAQGQLADVVTWNGVRYQVSDVQAWQGFGFWSAIATKVSAV